MQKNYIIGIDQGTTSSKAVLLDQAGNRLALAHSQTHRAIYPENGFVEQDAEEIYQAVCQLIRTVLQQAGATPEEVACISFSIQTSPIVFWDKETGKPVYNMIGWQCTRGRSIAEKLPAELHAYAKKVTGYGITGASDCAKIQWMFDHVPGLHARVRSGEVLVGPISTFLIWRLSGRKTFTVEINHANSMELCDGEMLDWDDRLLETFGMNRSIMPKVVASDLPLGETAVEGFAGIPMCGVLWDGWAALSSHRDYQLGDAKCSYGTGAHIAIDVGDQDGQAQKSNKIGAVFGGKPHRLLHGNVLYSGSTIQWVAESLGMLQSAREAEAVASAVPDCGGVYLVPAFSGIAAPYHDAHARACIVGMTRATTRAHIVRAALESTAYQIKDIAVSIEEANCFVPKRLFADGGASSNAFLMQFQADLLGFDVVCEDIEESAAVGAAYFGGKSSGFYPDLSKLADLSSGTTVYHPQMDPVKREALFAGWKNAVAAARISQGELHAK